MAKQVLLCGTCSAIIVDLPDEYGWIYCDNCDAIHDSAGHLVAEGVDTVTFEEIEQRAQSRHTS